MDNETLDCIVGSYSLLNASDYSTLIVGQKGENLY